MIWFKSIFLCALALVIIAPALSDPVPVNCQYTKGPWSTCDPTTNTKTRTLTLKKVQDEGKCEKTKTVEKKCKKICKYDKGQWSKCNTENEMTRTDVLRNPNDSESNCEKSKVVTKTCKNKADRPGKGQKRKHKQQEQQNKNKSKQN
ncbi:hypothetical protein V9T40_011525 [Parthenolecanium corni]|uniref:Pleiotrophin/Midkine C-terminal domain-containing protein n=1 Tax=Parthenolecanium corni TaxID=536013 RepID=A0AAN9XYN5_9HEMI